jgi:hypothetical protein
MALNLPLDTAEKYLWTWIEFVRLGPRRFRRALHVQPTRYMTAAQFFVCSVTICGALLGVAVATLDGLRITTLKHYDPVAVVGAHIVLLSVGVIVSAPLQRVVLWWPLSSPARVVDLLQAKFYCSGLIVLVSAVNVLTLYFLSEIFPYIANDRRQDTFAVALRSEWLLLSCLLVCYDFWSTCAFCRLRKRRLLEGFLIFWIVCTVGGASIGGIIGGLIGGVTGAFVAEKPQTWLANAIEWVEVSAVLILFVILSASPLAILLRLLRKRIARLRTAVSTEYPTL